MNLNTVFEHLSPGLVALTPAQNGEGDITDFSVAHLNAAAVAMIPGLSRGIMISSLLGGMAPADDNGALLTLLSSYTSAVPVITSIYVRSLRTDLRIETTPLPGEGLIVEFGDAGIGEASASDDLQKTSLLDAVLDSSVSGVVACEALRNESGGIVDFMFRTANEPAAAMLFYTREEIVGNTLLTLFPGNVASGLFDLYVGTTETGTPGRREVYYHYDSLDIYLDISSRKLGDGVVVTFTDISALKRAHIANEKTLQKLQSVIDTSQTGIFLFEPILSAAGEVVDFRFVLTNRMLAAYVGQEPEAINGALGSVWFPAYKTNGLFESYRDAFLTGKQSRFDFHYDSDGIDVWLDIMATRLGEELLVTFGDYTPLKNLQQQLEVSVAELRQSNTALEQFASIASHDLQEPLRKIQTFGNILQTRLGSNSSAEVTDVVSRMQSAAGRMRVLIEDLLTYSHVASGDRPLVHVSIGTLIAEVLVDLEQVIAEKQAEVITGPMPAITGDPLGFRQLFHNLLSNALKFTRDGVKPVIRMSSERVTGAGSGLALPAEAHTALFHLVTISDNGIGFEPEHSERIFGMFQRLHGRGDYPGTGVGLSIVQKVIQFHHGFFNAEGRPGEGATFRMLLPAGDVA